MSHEHSRYKLSPKLPFFDPTAGNFLGWAHDTSKKTSIDVLLVHFFVLLLSGNWPQLPKRTPALAHKQFAGRDTSGTHMAPTSHRALATQIAAALPTFSIADCVPLLVTQAPFTISTGSWILRLPTAHRLTWYLTRFLSKTSAYPFWPHLHFRNLLHEPPEVGFVEAQTHTHKICSNYTQAADVTLLWTWERMKHGQVWLVVDGRKVWKLLTKKLGL